jgi:hypothetical protein
MCVCVCVERIFVLKIDCIKILLLLKTICIAKITCTKKLLTWKNFLHLKIAYIEEKKTLKNYLDSKISCIEKLFILKICFKHPKRINHKKYGIRSFHIYVQYLYVAQKL